MFYLDKNIDLFENTIFKFLDGYWFAQDPVEIGISKKKDEPL